MCVCVCERERLHNSGNVCIVMGEDVVLSFQFLMSVDSRAEIQQGHM